MKRIGSMLALIIAPSVSAGPLQLLRDAAEAWAHEIDRWSFVQEVREFRGGEVVEVRLERFDPSNPDSSRWELLEVNGRQPTAEEVQAFDHRKNRKPRKRFASPDRYIDYDRVRVRSESATAVEYHVPLRGDLSLLIPFEDIDVRVIVDRATARILQVQVGLEEEMRIAFGLARVTELDMEITLHAPEPGASAGPADVEPRGTASASMFKFGKYAELTWTDFERVDGS